jgi:hypothetical protein
VRVHNKIAESSRNKKKIRTALPHARVMSPSVALDTRWRATATRITSIKNTTVVRKAVRLPMPVVKRDGSLEVPFDPRRRMKSDVNRVTKANAATVGNNLQRLGMHGYSWVIGDRGSSRPKTYQWGGARGQLSWYEI